MSWAVEDDPRKLASELVEASRGGPRWLAAFTRELESEALVDQLQWVLAVWGVSASEASHLFRGVTPSNVEMACARGPVRADLDGGELGCGDRSAGAVPEARPDPGYGAPQSHEPRRSVPARSWWRRARPWRDCSRRRRTRWSRWTGGISAQTGRALRETADQKRAASCRGRAHRRRSRSPASMLLRCSCRGSKRARASNWRAGRLKGRSALSPYRVYQFEPPPLTRARRTETT